MLKKYLVNGPAGIMPLDKLVIPGNVAELDDNDPRLPSWLAEGTLTELREKAEAPKEEEPERKKPGPKPKAKERE